VSVRIRCLTVEEGASARKGEISAHKGLVTDLRNDFFHPDVSKLEETGRAWRTFFTAGSPSGWRPLSSI
jgi:hypothetical protein